MRSTKLDASSGTTIRTRASPAWPEQSRLRTSMMGAKALGRDDLGRLAPGARADMVLVDLSGVHYGAVHDPIKSLVECGSAADVDTVIVDGRSLIESRRALVLDEAKLIDEVQKSGEDLWAGADAWRGASVDEVAPMSYPVAGV